jgi:tRNA-2-methylthio-N6-dimethylallyladenosine synthase
MKRNYTIDDYLRKVDRLVSACPEIALTTDMIIGFPGETEIDFQSTMQLLERVRFHGSFSFKYSDRPGTRAAELDSKLSEQEKGARLQIFQKRQDEISLARNRDYVGKTRTILVEHSDTTSIMGRTSTNHIVHVESGDKEIQAGDYIEVQITFGGQHALKGQLL